MPLRQGSPIQTASLLLLGLGWTAARAHAAVAVAPDATCTATPVDGMFRVLPVNGAVDLSKVPELSE